LRIRVYTGTVGNGVFMSINSGESWAPINNGLHEILILSLGIDPGNPSALYAGTEQSGVFKSINGGREWSPANVGITTGWILSLAVDPVTPATVYAGTWGGGVFKSTNSGANWLPVNSGLSTDDTWVKSLAIDPVNPATIYAGTSDGVLKSINSGGSWSPVNTGISSSWVNAMVVDPSSTATVYAGTSDGVFKSTNSGESWSSVNTGLTATWVLSLAIDSGNPATVYAGTYDGGIFKSTNGGASWSPVNTGLTTTWVQSLAIDPGNPATVYAGTYDGGVFKSMNGGASWSSNNAGLTNSDVKALTFDPNNPAIIFAGIYGHGVYSLTQAANTFTFHGLVTDHIGTPFSGAIVEMGGNPTVFTTTDENGAYSLTLPAATDLSLKVSEAGYLSVYTNIINSSSDIYDPVPAVLFPQTVLSGWGVTPGKGVIAAHVVDTADFSSNISGAVVTATSAIHTTSPYAVTYSAGSGFGGSATSSNGLVFVLNVDDGDTVTLHTLKDGWSFSDGVFSSYGDAVSEGLLQGTPQKARIKNTANYFANLSAACDDPASSFANPVQALAAEFVENLTLGQGKALSLEGGYDIGFASRSGVTSLLGILTIENGSLMIENLLIK